jgi:hypothetical protein
MNYLSSLSSTIGSYVNPERQANKEEANELTNSILKEKKIPYMEIGSWGSDQSLYRNDDNRQLEDIFSEKFSDHIISIIQFVKTKYYVNQRIPLKSIPFQHLPSDKKKFAEMSIDSLESIILREMNKGVGGFNIPIEIITMKMKYSTRESIESTMKNAITRFIDSSRTLDVSEIKFHGNIMINEHQNKNGVKDNIKTQDGKKQFKISDSIWPIECVVKSMKSNSDCSIEFNSINPTSEVILFNPVILKQKRGDTKINIHVDPSIVKTKNMQIDIPIADKHENNNNNIEKSTTEPPKFKQFVTQMSFNDIFNAPNKHKHYLKKNVLWSIFIAGSTLEYIEMTLVMKSAHRDYKFIKYNLQSLIIFESIMASPDIPIDLRKSVFDNTQVFGLHSNNTYCYKFPKLVWESVTDIIKKNIETTSLDQLDFSVKRFDQDNWCSIDISNINNTTANKIVCPDEKNIVFEIECDMVFRKFPSKHLFV